MSGLGQGKNGTNSINMFLATELTVVNKILSQGTLTIAEPVTTTNTMTIGNQVYTFLTGATYAKAQGTLTIAEPVDVGDTITVGATTYTFMSAATDAAGFIGGIGTSEAATKLAVVAAINGTDTFNTANASVTAAAWPSGDTCVITAILPGVAGNAIPFIEDITHASNVMDGSGTLGSTTAGILMTAGQIGIGANEAATKLAVVAAINGTDLVNTAHTQVSAAAWPSGDTCVITAKVGGTASNSIATTETFTHVSNIFDATTLGTTTEGVESTPVRGYKEGHMYRDDSYLYICVNTDVIGANWRRVSLGSTF